jgi:tetratricopeptide (TPR) repeat protein
MQNYQKALAINPDNAHAEAALSEVQEKLAANMAEVGKKEMAQVGAPPKKGEPKLGEVGQLREDIGHLEKAAQNFGQAEALAPGENNAQALQEQAAEQLNDLRSKLDQAQAKAGEGQAPPGAEGEPAPSEQPGEKPGEQKGQGMVAMKPMLSFSEIRGSTELEGQFKDLSNKRKIRDW